MARINWDKSNQYSGYNPTQEEQARQLRLQKELAKIKPKRKPGMATKNQMTFLRNNKLLRDNSVKEVSFALASKLISKFKSKQKKLKKEKRNGKTKNNNTGHRRDISRTRTTKYSTGLQPLNETVERND